VIYCLEKDSRLILAIMARYFPAPGPVADYTNNEEEFNSVNAEAEEMIPAELAAKLDKTGRTPNAGDVKYIFYTKSGPGPILQPIEEAILDTSTGLPIDVSHKHKRMRISA